MKKFIIVLLLFFTSFGLIACKNEEDSPRDIDCELYPTHIDCLEDEDPIVDEDPINTNYIDIYYMNDLHGAILPNDEQMGLAAIANFLITKKLENPDNTVILSGGDFLQGSALSNYYDGLSTINIMNEMYFDGFTLGNHEFDWGLEVVTNYFDDDETNGEANFPLLGANVFYKGTTTIPEGIDPYTIIERGNIKIGIIGTMGYGLENSIATSKVEDYEFAYPVPIIESYASYLRVSEGVDIVIVVSHDSGNINSDVAAFTGDAKVDAIFNAHSHNDYTQDSLGIPIVQSGAYGEFVGHVRLVLHESNIISFSMDNLIENDSELFESTNITVQNIIEAYQLETDPIFNTHIITSDDYLDRGELTYWIAEVMRVTTNSDIAFHNYGGTRVPISDGVSINLGVLYTVFPFDNVVKTVMLTGSQITQFKSSGDGTYYHTIIDEFEPDTYYKVATNDYIFDKVLYPFISGVDVINTGLLLRDLAEQEMILQSYLYSTFNVTNDILSIYIIPPSNYSFIDESTD